jgi:hypothetical protein
MFSGQRTQTGIGLDKVRVHSRHGSIGMLWVYADEHDRVGVQCTLADLVAATLRETAIRPAVQEDLNTVALPAIA